MAVPTPKRLGVQKGISNPTITSVPEKWSQQWFRGFITQFLQPADTRNATAGLGISISTSFGLPPTVSSQNQDLSYLVVTPDSNAPNERVISGEVGVVTLTDGGPGGNLTIGIATGGIGPAQLQEPVSTSVLGNPTALTAGVTDIQATADDTVLARTSGSLAFQALPVAAIEPIGADTVIGNATGAAAVPVAMSQTQLTSLVNVFTSTLSGAVPASGGSATTYLNGAGAFTTPAGGGGSLSVTDGTHTVAGVTALTFSGATVSGTTPNATATITGGGGSGTVTSASVVTANGFAGSVATATTTPAITLSTTITGILYGNGTSVAAAIASNFPTLNQSTTGNAATATNVAGGSANEVVYQTATGTTGFIAPSTSGYVLTSNGSGSAPTFQAASGGGSLSVTDGTTTVTGVTALTFSGATISGTTPNATATISGGGGAVTSPQYITTSGFDSISSSSAAILFVVLNGSATSESLVLPETPVDKQILMVKANYAISTFGLFGSATYKPTSIAAGQTYTFVYDAAASTWQ